MGRRAVMSGGAGPKSAPRSESPHRNTCSSVSGKDFDPPLSRDLTPKLPLLVSSDLPDNTLASGSPHSFFPLAL